jgi:phosphate/sulfate permease
VLGPLPRLHRLVLVITVVLVSAAAGTLVAARAVPPAEASAGAAVGALVGLLLSFALVHDFSHRHPRPARVPRRH